MRKAIAVLILASLTLPACGGDDDALLTAEEREWCSFGDATEESAMHFDIIFEAGLALSLDMDLVNISASEARAKYEAEGMDADAAVRAVSDDMAKDPTFAAACKLAYSER
jgi:hypothetical protein